MGFGLKKYVCVFLAVEIIDKFAQYCAMIRNTWFSACYANIANHNEITIGNQIDHHCYSFNLRSQFQEKI